MTLSLAGGERLPDEEAVGLLPLFNRMVTEYFSGLSSASGLTLGGLDASGRDASNELSFVLLDAYDQMRLRQPNLHLRVHPGSDPRLLERAHELLERGGGMPALFNDRAIVSALARPAHRLLTLLALREGVRRYFTEGRDV